jgi:hypothetical protein
MNVRCLWRMTILKFCMVAVHPCKVSQQDWERDNPMPFHSFIKELDDAKSFSQKKESKAKTQHHKQPTTMCCQDAPRKPSLSLVKVRKNSSPWKTRKSQRLGKPTRKTVRFSNNEEVAFRHVTREELGKVWYHPQDYDAFKIDCNQTAREYIRAGGDVTRLDPMKVCLRGLEQNLTRNSAITRRMFISSCIHFVLHQQKTHSDPEKLREVSRVVSESARNRAITVASFDEKLCRL